MIFGSKRLPGITEGFNALNFLFMNSDNNEVLSDLDDDSILNCTDFHLRPKFPIDPDKSMEKESHCMSPIYIGAEIDTTGMKTPAVGLSTFTYRPLGTASYLLQGNLLVALQGALIVAL